VECSVASRAEGDWYCYRNYWLRGLHVVSETEFSKTFKEVLAVPSVKVFS